MDKIKICNQCKNLKEFNKSNGNFSIFCISKKDGSKLRTWRVINHDFDLKNKDCIAPDWCPLNTCNNSKTLTNEEIVKKLKSLKPKVEFSELESDTIYHVPSYMNHKRFDAVVIEKNKFYIRIKNITTNETKILLPSDIEYLLMVKSRIKKMIKK